MATNTLNTRLSLKYDSTANWATSTLVLLKGELALELLESKNVKIKVGDGTNVFKDLPYANLTSAEIIALIKEQAVSSVSLVDGNANGKIGLNVDGTTTYISVKGLGSAAYTASSAYATAAQGTKADNAMPKSGGTFTGNVILNANPTAALGAATKQYVDSKISDGITASDAMVFKGTLGTNGTATSLPASGNTIGDTYKVITATTIPAANSQTGANVSAKIGDLVICIDETTPKWIVVPSGDEVVTTVQIDNSTSNLTTSAKSGTIKVGAAAAKQVDTTISNASTSTNLPTSAAVSAFVEGKNYITGISSLKVQMNSGTTEGTNQYTFDGTTDKTINISPASIGAAAASHGTHVSYGTSNPLVAGTASPGTASTVSRSDHVHPVQTNVETATKLATARAIDGVNFNGTAAITHYGSCNTAAATVEKVVACSNYTLVTGSRIIVKFTVTNTAANPTLNVNSTGAKAIYYRGAAINAGYLAAGRTYEFVYNGTQYELVGDIDTNTNTDTKVTNTLATTTKAYVTGTTTETTNTGTQVFDTGVYLDTVAGQLTAKTFKGNLSGNATTASSCTGNAATATKLATARSLSITGGATASAVNFDGSANVALSVSNLNTDYLTNGANTLILDCGNATV